MLNAGYLSPPAPALPTNRFPATFPYTRQASNNTRLSLAGNSPGGKFGLVKPSLLGLPEFCLSFDGASLESLRGGQWCVLDRLLPPGLLRVVLLTGRGHRGPGGAPRLPALPQGRISSILIGRAPTLLRSHWPRAPEC